MVGCAAPIKAPSENDASAKVFTPIKDKASLFIYRNENYGGAVGIPMALGCSIHGAENKVANVINTQRRNDVRT